MLRRGLDQTRDRDGRSQHLGEPDDAAVVRHFAHGNETVPTVVIGDVGLVNPSVRQVAAHLREHAPHLLPEGFEAPAPSLIGRLFGG